MHRIYRHFLEIPQVKFLVLDEADDLYKKDDRHEIPKLNAQIKRGRRDRVQTLFFSATLHTEEVQKMIAEITTRPIWVDLKGGEHIWMDSGGIPGHSRAGFLDIARCPS